MFRGSGRSKQGSLIIQAEAEETKRSDTVEVSEKSLINIFAKVNIVRAENTHSLTSFIEVSLQS